MTHHVTRHVTHHVTHHVTPSITPPMTHHVTPHMTRHVTHHVTRHVTPRTDSMRPGLAGVVQQRHIRQSVPVVHVAAAPQDLWVHTAP